MDKVSLLSRIAEALERLAPPHSTTDDFSAPGYIWQPERSELTPIHRIKKIDINLLKGIDLVKNTLLENTRRFAKNLPANNALLWGARGMGKSSLIKAIHAQFESELKLIEVHKEDIETLPRLMMKLNETTHHFILFCDDLSFDEADTSYKSLKTILEGGLEGKPENVIFYATSNRRHLLPREMIDNQNSSAINPGEAIEEKISLSDRFGLWLGFHHCSQEEYLAMVKSYCQYYNLSFDQASALEWSISRGSRSGRVAWQYIQDHAGKTGKSLTPP